MLRIQDVAAKLGIDNKDILPYGHHMAKLPLSLGEGTSPGRLILVSAITPTPAGEGKTSTSIGLGDALSAAGQKVCLALREPSMGPCMGIKGGGTGGGQSQLVPSDQINLHFTGDFHAIAAAHNLLAAVIDNRLHFGGDLGLDPRRVVWKRVMDVNDRALRGVMTGLGGPTMGMPRQSGFDITAASELMAMVCLTDGYEDLRERIDRILVAFDRNKEPVEAKRLGVTGSLLAMLRDVLPPNLAQTLHGTPALVHGGPFANIAHGCNSVIATKMALSLADWVVTEAGFGFDLGAEKFFNIKCRTAGLNPAAVVLVATVRALKMHGGRAKDELEIPDVEATTRGLENLEKHIYSVRSFGQRPIVSLNRFTADTEEEIDVVRRWCESQNIPFALAEHFSKGPEGTVDLAKLVMATAESPPEPYRPLYELDASTADKIRTVAKKMYGARDVIFTKKAEKDLRDAERLGYGQLPICMAKTQSSLSDDPKLRGRPRDFDITVRGLEINAGAGFLVVLTGDMMRMPGLPRKPQAEAIDLVDGEITGLR